MHKNFLIILPLFIILNLRGQGNEQLQLKAPLNDEIDNVFELFVTEKVENRIRNSSGKKISIKNFTLLYNGDSLKLKSIKTRGKTSLTFERKSFSVSLIDPIIINGTEIKKFALLALPMDINYWRNRVSFILLKELNLFPLMNTYCEFRINMDTRGIYLFVQKSEDYIKKINSPILIRQTVDNQFEIDYEKGDEAKVLRKKFQNIRTLSNKYSGRQLADTLENILDLNQYWRWIAFNFMVMNGDYSDEVYFFYDPGNHLFRIIPWDYDDIFSSQPHEGWQTRMATIEHNLIYSGESLFDRVIDKDEYLYSGYTDEFKKMISIITPAVIRKTFEQAYRDLYPYFSSPDIIGQSSKDTSGLTNINYLQEDLNKHFDFLIMRYGVILSMLDL